MCAIHLHLGSFNCACGRWAFFLIEAGDSLFKRADGRLDFASTSIRRAVIGLFDHPTDVPKYHRSLAKNLANRRGEYQLNAAQPSDRRPALQVVAKLEMLGEC